MRLAADDPDLADAVDDLALPTLYETVVSAVREITTEEVNKASLMRK